MLERFRGELLTIQIQLPLPFLESGMRKCAKLTRLRTVTSIILYSINRTNYIDSTHRVQTSDNALFCRLILVSSFAGRILIYILFNSCNRSKAREAVPKCRDGHVTLTTCFFGVTGHPFDRRPTCHEEPIVYIKFEEPMNAYIHPFRS